MEAHTLDAIERICSVLRQYPVKRAALFGSFARAEETDTSDADILVEIIREREVSNSSV